MRSKSFFPAVVLITMLITLPVVTGCGGGKSLPDQVTVEFPDGSTAAATLGSGPASLANSEWAVFRAGTTGAGTQFVRLVFDEDGGIEEFADNTISPHIFGDTIYLDGQVHATAQSGLTYTAGVYGAESADGQGIAFEVRLKGFFAGFTAATGEASANATRVGDDTLEGTFYYKTEVTLIDMPEGNQEETFDFIAERL
jgi:hypothetical protein